MYEKKFAVMLTDTQEIKTLECDPQEELFEIARGTIGCEWIELVEAEPLAKKGYLMLIDEEGKLKKGPVSINCLANDLYGADRHGDAIVGNVMVVRAENERLTLLTKEENNWVVHQSFRTTEAEDELIRQKMKVFGIRKKSLLFRAMVLNGYLLKLDLPEIRELIRLMKNLTNNVNQMAKNLHEQGSIYETEIDDVKQRLDQTWDILREILSRLDQSEK